MRAATLGPSRLGVPRARPKFFGPVPLFLRQKRAWMRNSEKKFTIYGFYR